MDGTKVLGLAVGAFLLMAVPVDKAQAASLINPGAAALVRHDAQQELTTEVHWHWHHHHWHHHHWWHHRHW